MSVAELQMLVDKAVAKETAALTHALKKSRATREAQTARIRELQGFAQKYQRELAAARSHLRNCNCE